MSQPIDFYNDPSVEQCCEAPNWNLQYFQTDPINFQFYVGRCEKENQKVSNPTFLGGDVDEVPDWDSTGVVNFNNGSVTGARLLGNASIFQTGISGFTAGTSYVLRLVINTFTTGGFMDTTLTVTGASEPISFIPQTNEYEFFIQGNGTGTITLETIKGDLDQTDITTIQSVQIFEITQPTITVEDLEGNTITQIISTIYEAPYLTASFQPNNLVIAEGCFKIRVTRTCGSETESFLSEVISLKPSNNCDILIGACGSTNYNSDGFQPLLRVKANLRADQAPEYNINRTQSANGLQRVTYGKLNKAYTLYFDQLPEHIRDWVYTLALMNEIAIKVGGNPQAKYIVTEEPDAPEFVTGDDQMATMNLILQKKQELTESIYKGECTVSLPPKALGSAALGFAIKAGENTAIEAE